MDKNLLTAIDNSEKGQTKHNLIEHSKIGSTHIKFNNTKMIFIRRTIHIWINRYIKLIKLYLFFEIFFNKLKKTKHTQKEAYNLIA